MGSPLVARLWHIELSGYEHLPPDGPAILCPNHISFLDSALLMFTVSRNISFVGKAEYMSSWKTRRLFPALGMIPIDRSGGAKSMVALDAAKDVLRRGELFGIYPEGTRSRDGSLGKGRTGAARLALTVGCPVYPVGIVGTDLIQPPGARAPRLGMTCRISIGRPILPEPYMARRSAHLARRSMTDEIMFEIRELSGQRYVDRYHGASGVVGQASSVGVAHVDDPDSVVTRTGPTNGSSEERHLVPTFAT